MSPWNLIPGHVTRNAVGFSCLAQWHAAARGRLGSYMVATRTGPVVGRFHDRVRPIVRVVTGGTADARVRRVVTLAQRNAVRLKANVSDALRTVVVDVSPRAV